MHRDKRKDPFRLFLASLSFLYNRGVTARILAYRLGILQCHRLPAFVVSVGNLGVGGTGKTPAVRTIAAWALKQGYRPAILSRGYGGSFREKVLIVSDGKEIKSVPAASGDEPYLLAKILQDIPVIVSKARYKGGLVACEEFSCNFLILDDGFQHLELHRDLDIVLLDALSPFGNGFSLPRGPLREPVEQLGRADVIILTRYRRREKGNNALVDLSGRFPGTPVFPSDHIPARVIFPVKNGETDLQGLKRARVTAFAGIAHPEYFRETLEALDVELLAFTAFGDHHAYTRREIAGLIGEKERLNADYILMTGKDWVKVEQTGAVSPEMAYIDIRFCIVEQGEAFFTLVRNAVQRKQAQE
jgi:tetraacyldisaccharide 4'-kinase